MEELVSIIIPVYNCEKYLRENVESVIEQSHRNLEVIYVDDGSTDQSASILRSYAEKDPRIVIVPQENQGVSSARNTGLQRAKGEYIAFVDADDYIDSRYVEGLLRSMRDTDADISCCGLVLHRPDKEILLHDAKECCVWNRTEALEHLVTGKMMEPGVVAKMFRREVLRGVSFEPSIRYNEDYLFDLRAFCNSDKVVFCGGIYYYYILHRSSATTSAPLLGQIEDVTRVAEIAMELPVEETITALLKRRKYIGYLTAYNSLLYESGEKIETMKRELRGKIVGNKAYYRSVGLTKREYFFYCGISVCPGLYKYIFRGLKRILPDRRIFKI